MSKRVLITGSNGFIGKTLINHILENTDYDIVALARSESSFDEINNERESIDLSRIICITNNEFLNSYYEKVDIAVHLAFSRNLTDIKKLSDSLTFTNNISSDILIHSDIVCSQISFSNIISILLLIISIGQFHHPIFCNISIYFFSHLYLITFAGTPTAIAYAGILCVTTAPAPIIAPFPILTLLSIFTPAAIHTSLPISHFSFSSNIKALKSFPDNCINRSFVIVLTFK
jgi:hypothetical protein